MAFTVSCLSVLLGLPGNSILIHALRTRIKQKRAAMSRFILNLASTDLSALLTYVPFYTMMYGKNNLMTPVVLCKLMDSVMCVLVTVSMYTHVAIAVERRRAIVFPLHPKPSPRKVKICLWFIWMIPSVVFGTSLPITNLGNRISCTLELKGVSAINKAIYLLLAPSLLFLFPVGLILWAYGHITFKLKRNRIPSEDLRNNSAVIVRVKKQRKVLRTLKSLAVIFIATIFSFFMIHILMYFFEGSSREFFWLKKFFPFILSIHFSIYALNPVVLYISSNDYRNAFNDILNVPLH